MRKAISLASLATLLVTGGVLPSASAASATPTTSSGAAPVTLLHEFRPIGGVGNNLVNPRLNVTPNSGERTLAPLNFRTGSRDALVRGPNPRTISNVIAGGTGQHGENAGTLDPVASAWLYVFGQFVDHDLDLESNSPAGTPINITVPAGDPVFTAGTTIDMTRDVRSPASNTVLNTVAGYLDLSQLYGSSTDVANSLRNPDGTLKTSDNGQSLPVVNGVYVTGDPRVMENPELTAVTTLFMREHNWWVGQLHAQHPAWTGEQLYQMARAITTAEYQNIVYQEYLPVLIGAVLGPYRGYSPDINAQVSQEFSTAAFRVGHSEVSDTQEGLDNQGHTVFTESLAQAFFNTPAEDEANGFNALLRGVSADSSAATDVYTVSVLRNLLFAPLAGGNVDQVDLIAIDIQRERDAGVATLNGTRRALGLPAYTSFAQLTPDSVLQQSFSMLYGRVENVDLFMGGLAETHARGAAVGPTFQSIIADQFNALRAGDRFFWLNQPFDVRTRAAIGDTRLSDIITRNTDTLNSPEQVFVLTAARTGPHLEAPSIDTHGRGGAPFLLP